MSGISVVSVSTRSISVVFASSKFHNFIPASNSIIGASHVGLGQYLQNAC